MVKKTKKDIGDLVGGFATLGIGSAIGAGIQARAPAGTPNLMGGFSTAASFAPTLSTAVMGSNVLRIVKKKYGKKKVI